MSWKRDTWERNKTEERTKRRNPRDSVSLSTANKRFPVLRPVDSQDSERIGMLAHAIDKRLRDDPDVTGYSGMFQRGILSARHTVSLYGFREMKQLSKARLPGDPDTFLRELGQRSDTAALPLQVYPLRVGFFGGWYNNHVILGLSFDEESTETLRQERLDTLDVLGVDPHDAKSPHPHISLGRVIIRREYGPIVRRTGNEMLRKFGSLMLHQVTADYPD